ncbi:MAG: 2-succinyl-5-enolpyruvyl-6-hydroxy-3-cyclohexene-1-carboxylic-acid synthase [Candidatus Hydrogenedentota bacterium]
MTETDATLNQLWAGLLVEELVRNGVDTFCISPGSRSTPLTIAAARNSLANCVMHYDERGAAFFALGYARGAEKPAALICTSGTATANFYPAIIEAGQSRIPMVVLTADRPPELLETGANQTIRQAGMFGPYTRWRFDLPCPTREIAPAFVLTTIDQAVYRATRPEAGPVHINCAYREPLAPNKEESGLNSYIEPLAEWSASQEPYTRYVPPFRGLDVETAALLHDMVEEARRPVVAVGQLDRAEERTAVAGLISKLRYPAFPGVTSGLRLGYRGESTISYFDLLLSSPETARDLAPDLLLHIGGSMVSKSFQLWLERCRPAHYVRIADHPDREDPGHLASLRVEADIPQACEALMTRDMGVKESDKRARIWLAGIREYQNRATRILDECFEAHEDLSEPAVARCVAAAVRESDGLFLGNSMPIRDMERYAPATGACPAVFANRGASGIDGNIATVAGVAHGSGRAITAILGDLATLHDLNSLALLREVKVPVVLVVINNNGGGVFHFLPVAEHKEVLEPYFTTPHGLGFGHACAMYGLAYVRPESLAEFRTEYEAALDTPRATLLEVRTDRTENAALHNRIDTEALTALRSREGTDGHL